MQTRPRLSADLTVLIVWPLAAMLAMWLMLEIWLMAGAAISLFNLWQPHW